MAVYVWDGSFDGLLCALAAAAADPAAELSRETPKQADLFSPPVAVYADPDRADEFLKKLCAIAGPETEDDLKLCFLSSESGLAPALLSYARKAFSSGKTLHSMLADPAVSRVKKAAAGVLREAHRFKGFVRFRELSDGSLYARIKPDHNVVPLLARHFKARMAGSDWVIHDEVRGLAAMHFGGRLRVAELSGAPNPPSSEKEAEVAGLWRAFFGAVAIKERENPGLQRRLVPLKYRSNLTEFSGD